MVTTDKVYQMSVECPYWVTDHLAGCGLPAPCTVRRLAKEGIVHVVVLVESHEVYDYWPNIEAYFETLSAHGMGHSWLPTPDDGAPDPDDAIRVFEHVYRLEKLGAKTLFHCYGGISRSPTVITAYLIAKGLKLEEALRMVRRANPYASFTDEQVLFIEMFEKFYSGALLKQS